jgi:hypothetical protein
MCAMRRSQALRDFYSALGIAEALLRAEGKYPDPPSPRLLKRVQGTRGGAAVLMVAAFEDYLKELVEERLHKLTLHPIKFKPKNVPIEMVHHNMRHTLEKALESSKSSQLSSADRVALLRSATHQVTIETINVQFFSELARSNPNARKVRALFKALGVQDVFGAVKADFDVRWGGPTANTFIADTLDSILSRRHEVAHTASVLNVSRKDLHEGLKFLHLLATLCDEELSRHVRKILR